jgi:transketolase
MADLAQIPDAELRGKIVRTIQMLAVDAIELSKSGHPGTPMGAADLALVLWTRAMRFDPTHPDWPGRDRFVLSVGHASMLLYSMLHLTGYDLRLDELKRFRQRHSRAAGHPERGVCPGVETTTGPLGQGFATAVGMALSGRMLSARMGSDGPALPGDYRVYVLSSDGDMMEGITYEAASLAGNLGLGNLIVVYDSNRITIEGATDLSQGEDIAARFAAMGWHVQSVDGYDAAGVEMALDIAAAEVNRPSLVIARTVIAHGAATREGSEASHGAPLGAEEVRLTKVKLDWPLKPTFLVPDDVRAYFAQVKDACVARRLSWERDFDAWRTAHPDLAANLDSMNSTETPDDLASLLLVAASKDAGKATRNQASRALQAAAGCLPSLVGGSADLGPSNMTWIDGGGSVVRGDFAGRTLHFGIREHAMGAAVNGMTLQGSFRVYGSTFLVFCDYLRPALRLAALMEIPSIFVFSHDSFHVGEDGPTHQPIEHLWMLRSIPGMTVFRPADPVEVAAAWSYALARDHGPTCIVTTRQAVPAFDRPSGNGIDAALRGASVVRDCAAGNQPDLIVVATGSEVASCMEAAAAVEADAGIRIRIVSMPSLERFRAQDVEYRLSILPKGIPVAVVEAGSSVGWWQLAGSNGTVLGLDHFGACGPANVLNEEFGFTSQAIGDRLVSWWNSTR